MLSFACLALFLFVKMSMNERREGEKSVHMIYGVLKDIIIRLTRGRIRPLTFFFYMTIPPSTWIVWPVIYAAAGSNAKNLTMPAISSG